MRSGTGRRAWKALLAVAALAVVAVAPASPAMAAVKKTTAKCDATGWATVAGRPAALTALAPAGIYVWNEKGVWRVAVTHSDRRVQVFQGTVSFDVAMTATPVGVEGRFDVVVPNKNSASFTFKNYGGIDSIAITAPCATTVSVTGTIDGAPIDVSQIFLGPTGTNPAAVPATITKSSVGASAPTTAAAAATSGGSCAASQWPAATAGKPTLKPRSASGVYLSSDKSGWLVLMSGDSGRPQVFKGKITIVAPAATGGVVVQPLSVEGGKDEVTVEGNTVLFELKVANGIREFVLYAPCASQLTFEGTIDGVAITPAQMFVGGAATPVVAVPFTVNR